MVTYGDTPSTNIRFGVSYVYIMTNRASNMSSQRVERVDFNGHCHWCWFNSDRK